MRKTNTHTYAGTITRSPFTRRQRNPRNYFSADELAGARKFDYGRSANVTFLSSHTYTHTRAIARSFKVQQSKCAAGHIFTYSACIGIYSRVCVFSAAARGVNRQLFSCIPTCFLSLFRLTRRRDRSCSLLLLLFASAKVPRPVSVIVYQT